MFLWYHLSLKMAVYFKQFSSSFVAIIVVIVLVVLAVTVIVSACVRACIFCFLCVLPDPAIAWSGSPKLVGQGPKTVVFAGVGGQQYRESLIAGQWVSEERQPEDIVTTDYPSLEEGISIAQHPVLRLAVTHPAYLWQGHPSNALSTPDMEGRVDRWMTGRPPKEADNNRNSFKGG